MKKFKIIKKSNGFITWEICEICHCRFDTSNEIDEIEANKYACYECVNLPGKAAKKRIRDIIQYHEDAIKSLRHNIQKYFN